MTESWAGNVDCLVFPEMALSGFSMSLHATTLEPEDHEEFSRIAKEMGSSVIYGGVEDGYNCIFSTFPGEKRTTQYRKRHLFSFAGEREHYKVGDTGTIAIIGGTRFALGICYDLRFSYHFWSLAEHCDAYLVIASWPEGRREHWLALLRARAIENLAYVVGVNRVGSDPKLTYSGDSAVFSPFGERVLECGRQEGIYSCEIDPRLTAEVRGKYRFLEDRTQ